MAVNVAWPRFGPFNRASSHAHVKSESIAEPLVKPLDPPKAVIDGVEQDLRAYILEEFAHARHIIRDLETHEIECDTCSPECIRWERDQWAKLGELMTTLSISMRSRAEGCTLYLAN